MTRNRSSPLKLKCTPEQVDEAAVWMTLLHASDRSEQTDRGFRLWLEANPAHSIAFEKVSMAHEITAALPRKPFPGPAQWERVGFRAGVVRATTGIAAALALAALGLFFYWRNAGVATQLGEQRMLTLADGSQVVLNTDTRVVVRYDKNTRRVELKAGEAFFDVARQSRRPFIVLAGDRQVMALGTSFVVRHDSQTTAVTLIDGTVAVSGLKLNLAALDSSPLTPLQRSEREGPVKRKREATREGVTILSPGERMVFAAKGPPQVDQPPLNELTAWRTGHVQFDQVPLEDAIAEMNRYSPIKLLFARPEAARIPISGIFRAGATESFARAVAAAYRLQVVRKPDAILLSGLPGPTNQPAVAEISSPNN